MKVITSWNWKQFGLGFWFMRGKGTLGWILWIDIAWFSVEVSKDIGDTDK